MAQARRTRAGLDAERVIDAAVAVADAEGFDAVSLSAVAATLGVRTPSLYHHVDGLDGVRRGIALRGLLGIDVALRDATVGRSGADALDALAGAYRAYAAGHPGAYAATQRTDLNADDTLRDAAARPLQVVFAVIRHWEPDEQEQVHLVRAVRSALHGFVTLEAGAGFGMPASRDESFAVLVRLHVAALEAHAAQRGR